MDSLSAVQAFEAALRLHARGDLAGADAYYRWALQKGYRHPHLLSNLGLICKQRGEYEEAWDLCQQVLALQPREPSFWINALNLLQAQGRLVQAVTLARQATDLLPDCADLQCQQGWLLRLTGDLEGALEAVKMALVLEPGLLLAQIRAGVILRELGRLAEAETVTRQALALDPQSAGSYMNLAVILKDGARLREALAAIRQAAALNPELPGVHFNHASILRDLGQPEAALQAIQRARSVDGVSASVLALQGAMLQSLGDLEAAEAILRQALALDPACSQAYLSLSTQCKLANDDPLYGAMVQASEQAATLAERCDLFFARAKAEHDQKRFTEAAQSLQEANRLKQRLRPSNAKEYLELVAAIDHRFWQLDQLALKQREGEASDTELIEAGLGSGCIFIVGMPRSGSTLAESILSMNGDCFPLGEVDLFPSAFRAAEMMLDSGVAWTRACGRLAREYLAERRERASGFPWTTDKLLSNYQYCGHLLTALPEARVIHCSRNPLDVLLSMYRANFSVGMGYASSLIDAARVYAQQARMMAAYGQRFPDRIYSCCYEQLVTDPAREIRRLVAWLGWSWSEDYLQPHRNRRSVSTASVVQVRSPIHAGSVGSWRRYAALLEPAVQELERQGISVRPSGWFAS